MKQYDVKCPVCGKINTGLYLEESSGWMECQCCGADVEANIMPDGHALPLLTSHLCALTLKRKGIPTRKKTIEK